MKLKVITIGSATLDVFMRSDQFQIVGGGTYGEGRSECFPLGKKIEVDELTLATGGGATNVAVSLARKNLSAACLSIIGNDVNGREVLKVLKHEGVYIDFVHIHERFKTGYAVILVNQAGDRSVLVHRGASAHLEASFLEWDRFDTEWLYVSSLGGDIELLGLILEGAANKKIKTVVNPGSRELKKPEPLKALLSMVDILLLNREEASLLTGVEFKNEEEILKTLISLLRGAGSHSIAVITDAQRGVTVADGSRIYRAGIFPEKEIMDRTGAGDAFGSGFLAGFLLQGQGEDQLEKCISEAIRVGSANATSVIEHVGAKKGLLRREDLADERWQGLEIRVSVS